MGFGGILAAMAGGVGTALMKNAENMWKEKAAQKELDWRSKEYALGRQHDLELEDRRHQNRIKEAALQARLAKNGGDVAKKEVESIIKGAASRKEKINALTAQYNQLEEGNPLKSELAKQITLEQDQLNYYTSQPTYQNAFNKLPIGEQEAVSTALGMPTAGYNNYVNQRQEQQRLQQEEQQKRQAAEQAKADETRRRLAQSAEQAKIDELRRRIDKNAEYTKMIGKVMNGGLTAQKGT